jgi:hypothetical protein
MVETPSDGDDQAPNKDVIRHPPVPARANVPMERA